MKGGLLSKNLGFSRNLGLRMAQKSKSWEQVGGKEAIKRVFYKYKYFNLSINSSQILPLHHLLSLHCLELVFNTYLWC
jgi:hypothetical protein